MLMCPKCQGTSMKVVRYVLVEVPLEDEEIVTHKRTLVKPTTKILGTGNKRQFRCQSCHHIF